MLAALFAAPPAGAVRAKPPKSCGGITFTPRTEDGIWNIRAFHAGCRKARQVARASRPLSVTRGPYSYRKSGFRCSGKPAASGLPRVWWRCTRGRSSVVKFTRT
jgi:hypothetical protein